MNCSEVDDSLDARAAGLLEAPRDRELTDHVGGCADCDARARRLAGLEDALRRGSELEEQAALRVPGLRARLQAGLLEQSAARPAGEPRWKLLLLAASLLLCLFLLKFIVRPAAPRETPRAPEAPAAATSATQERNEPSPAPPFVGITLDATGTARDVLTDIAARALIPKELFVFQNAGGDKVSVSLKNATLLQAIDDVCRNTFALSYKRERKPGDQSLTFFTAPFQERPSAYVRHYKVQVMSVRVPKPEERSNVPTLDLEVTWAPGVRPCSMTHVSDLVIADDQGRVLNDGLVRIATVPQFFTIEFFRENPEFAAFRFPQEGTRSLSVRGHLEFRYARERGAVVFNAPSVQKGTTIEMDGLKATLTEFKQNDRDIQIEFDTVDKPDPTTLQRISRADVEAITESGERLSAGFNCGMRSRGNASSWVFKMKSSRPEGVREIRIPYVRSYDTDRADFEIKGIPYPK